MFKALCCRGKNSALESHRRGKGLVLSPPRGAHSVSGCCVHLHECVCAHVRTWCQLSLVAGPYSKDS